MRPLALIAVLATVPLAACGAAKPDPRAAVRATYAAYGKAILAADGARGCALLSAAAQRAFLSADHQLGGTDSTCPPAFDRLARRVPRTTYTLSDVVVVLGTASGTNPHLTGSAARPIAFVRVKGDWKLDAASTG